MCFMAAVLAMAAGCTKYELNTYFNVPDELVSPDPVELDVTSAKTVVLSWNGGSAEDGGIILYEVSFDKKGGDFSSPIAVMKSDQGAFNTLTLTHSALNTMARNAGIKPKESGSLIWTVSASRGGVKKASGLSSEIKLTRGEGIDNIPGHLFVSGSAALEAGQEFRLVEEGMFVIYTELGNGPLKFTSEKGGGINFYASESGKLNEGDGAYDVVKAPASGLARITVDFNSLKFSIEQIDKKVRCIWSATYADVAVLDYAGNGNFTGEGDVVFLGPGREGTPDWCTWVEERYYFIAKVDGAEKCWGSTFGGGAPLPDGTKEFYIVKENAWEQWNNCWKMDHAYDMTHVKFAIHTNKDNLMVHSYSN